MALIINKNSSCHLIHIFALIGSMLILTTCKKEKELPTILTTVASEITNNSATIGGNVTSNGGASVTARGICRSTTTNPSLSDSITVEGTGSGIFTSNLTGLSASTIYYFRAYATNSEGTAYGNELSFSTATGPPRLTTKDVTSIQATTASSGGNIIDNGGASVTVRGVCWNTTNNPSLSDSITVNGTGTGTFTSNLTGLDPYTLYYVRAYATNSGGTAYGNELSFKTAAGSPRLTTTEVTSIQATTASGGGDITNSGGASVTARGICWSTGQDPTVADSHTDEGIGIGSYTSNLTGLLTDTIYNVRAYATNSTGTYYGNQVTFVSIPPGEVYDIDSIRYNTVTIGTQVWMVKNLRTTRLNDGTPIPYVPDNTEWSNLTTPAFSYLSLNTYGALYNGYTIETEKLCPTGWHVSSEDDMILLTDYLGGLSVAGGKLKETGTAHWSSPNTGATNISGFTALPGGYRSMQGGFGFSGYQGRWWESAYGNVFALDYSSSDINLNMGCMIKCGMTVRCIKD